VDEGAHVVARYLELGYPVEPLIAKARALGADIEFV